MASVPAPRDLAASRVIDHEKYGSRIVIVETPRFNDTEKSDEQILKLIGDWLKKSTLSWSPTTRTITMTTSVHIQRRSTPIRDCVCAQHQRCVDGWDISPHSAYVRGNHWLQRSNERRYCHCEMGYTCWDRCSCCNDMGGDFAGEILERSGPPQQYCTSLMQRVRLCMENRRRYRQEKYPEGEEKTCLQFQRERVDQKKPLMKTRAKSASRSARS